MSTTVQFDFGAGQPVGARLPRVALADVFELHNDNAEERLVAGGVIVDLQLHKGDAPTRVEVKPGAFLIRLRTPEGRLLMRRVNVEPGQDPALIFLPKQPAPKPESPPTAVDDLVIMQRLAVPDVLSGLTSDRKPAVPREWWAAQSMTDAKEPVTISNLPGFHASELVEPKYDYMGIARLQARSLQEIPSPDGSLHDITAKLVGEIAVVQGAKLHGNRESPFAKWKSPVRNRELAGERSDEGRGARYFSLSYRAEEWLSPLHIACVPGRWEKRDGSLADVFANYYEREIGNTLIRALRVEVDDPDLGGLLDFLQQGDLSGSTRMLKSATKLLYRKWRNPYASAAAGYVLVQAGRWPEEHENWRQWVLNLAQRYSSLPDGAILFTTLLLQSRSDELKNLNYEGGRGNHFTNALSAAFEAIRRGPPLFRHGLKMMATNLAILEGKRSNGWETLEPFVSFRRQAGTFESFLCASTPTNHSACLMSELTNAIGEPRPWVEVHALAAEHGDCIVLSYGDGKAHFRLVVDAGVASTVDRIKRVLDASGDAVWELLVVTHIDLDHIGGALSLLSEQSIATRFKDIWFNGRQHLELGREAMAVKEGMQLAELLDRKGISWNVAFGKDAVCLAADDAPVRKTLPVSKAVITILSPSMTSLAKLRLLWDSWEERQKQMAEKPTKAMSAAARQNAPDVEVLSAAPLNIRELAATKTGTDSSVTNGSSIAFIFEYAGIRILLGADAHADVLMNSAAKLPPEMLNLDVFKLPHHGSLANVTQRLTQKLPAQKYLLTTDGKRHDTHPSDVAIARALTVTPNAELLFNYPNQTYERWANRPLERGYTFKVRAGEGEEGIRVRLEAAPGQGVS